MVRPADLDAIHEFWFGPPGGERVNPELWFGASPQIDAEITRRFGSFVDEAAIADWDIASLSPSQRLGLIVLLDQFPRNLHRDSALTYRHDSRARQIATDVRRSESAQFSPIEAMFAVLPFGHSENLADQDLAVAAMETEIMPRVPPNHQFWTYALHRARLYRDQIARFGRFPHRNALLGRVSTPEELAYLEAGTGSD
jgi:uncharacterized protein (DUF924 family)